MRGVHLMFGTLVEGLVEAKRELLEGHLEQGKEVYKVCFKRRQELCKGCLDRGKASTTSSSIRK